MRTDRRRAAAGLGMVLGMASLAGVVMSVVVVGHPSSHAGPVYTVAQVRAGLTRQPSAWAGRTVLVRGVAFESFWATGPMSGEGHPCDPRFFGGHPQLCPLVRANGATVYLTLMDDSVQFDPRHPHCR